jgi:catalase
MAPRNVADSPPVEHSTATACWSPGALIDGLYADFPDYRPGTRPIHTKGISVEGFFRPSRAASHYCVANHFAALPTRTPELIPVVVRFSHANGSPVPDGTRQIHGMAVKFYGGDLAFDQRSGTQRSSLETDLVCMNVPMFIAKTPDKVLEFEQAYVPRPVIKPTLMEKLRALLTMCPLPPQIPGVKESGDAGLIRFAQRYQPAQAFTVANSMLGMPVSFTRSTYHAVHAFDLEGSDGVHRMARFTFEPANGVRNEEKDHFAENYLEDELIERLDGPAPSRFTLKAQLADQWDDSSDPTKPWPLNRRRIGMGTLSLTNLVADQDTYCERLVFNPMRLVPGISPSDDPLLAARREIYNLSQERRGANQCPVGFASEPAG